MEDVFYDIPGYEGYYQVTKEGKVRGVDRLIKCGEGVTLKKGEKRKLYVANTGYWSVDFCKNGVYKKFGLHRILAETFIPNPENKREVNHIDGNKLNNDISNLEWVTSSENRYHAVKTGLLKVGKRHRGFDNVGSKLVLDTNTGVYYSCSREAFEALGRFNHKAVMAMLNGRQKNKTSLIYV